jgi:hypothetical protein
MHPATGKPYAYPRHRPSETDLRHVPYVHEDLLDDLIDALAADPLIQRFGMVAERVAAHGDDGGLLVTAASARADRGGSAAWVRANQAGGRHAAAVAAVVAALRAGSDPDDEAAELEAIEIAFREAKPEADPGEWIGIMRWAERAARRRPRAELERRLGLEVAAHG